MGGEATTTTTNGASAPNGAAAAAPGALPAGGAAAPVQRTQASQLPEAALRARLDSHRRQGAEEERKKLLADLGIEDVDTWKQQREEQNKKLAAYEQSAEEQKRASLSEVERLRADLAVKDARIAELESQLSQRDVAIQASKADLMVREVIGLHIDPEMQDVATGLLREHVRKLPVKDRDRFKKEDAEAFFAKLAADRPKFAKPAAQTTPAAEAKKTDEKPKPAPLKKPLTTGAKPNAVIPTKPSPVNGAKKDASQLSDKDLEARWAKFGAKPPPKR